MKKSNITVDFWTSRSSKNNWTIQLQAAGRDSGGPFDLLIELPSWQMLTCNESIPKPVHSMPLDIQQSII